MIVCNANMKVPGLVVFLLVWRLCRVWQFQQSSGAKSRSQICLWSKCTSGNVREILQRVRSYPTFDVFPAHLAG